MTMQPQYTCPECRSAYLGYDIAHDDYYCFPCDISFTVLSTEETHKLYDGGPPKRTGWISPLHRRAWVAEQPQGGCMRTPLADARAAAQRAKSSWKLPAEYWSVFSSGLHIGNKIDFIRWRLITLGMATQKQ